MRGDSLFAMEQKRILQVVVASPGDVQTERDTLPAVIDELNLGIAAERNLLLELHRWETDAYPGFHPEGPQGLIDPVLKIEDCDILIGLFWKRFGTPTKGAQSGTEHEFLSAYQAWQQNRRPQIMVYFNQKAYTPKSADEIDQWGRVLDFKHRFPKEGLWWEYKGKAQFERLVRNHLTQFIRRHHPSSLPTMSGGETGQNRAGEGAQNARYRSADELTKEYLAGLARRISTVHLFGDEEPRALDKVFVELTIVEDYRRPTAHAEFLGLLDAKLRQQQGPFARAEIEIKRRQPGGAGAQLKRMVKPDDLLRERTQVVVTGAPGCGKTTLLRYLAWKTSEARERLPIFLELKTVTSDDFDRAQHDLAKLLFDEVVAGPLALIGVERERLRESFLTRLAAGEVAIFLDGLDEVSGTDFFPRLCESVGEFVRRMPRANTLIISTRPYALQSRLEGLKEMEIAPLNQRQIEEFFAHYYSGDPVAQQHLRTLLQRRPLHELLRVPFLLAMVAQLYRYEQRVVEDRLELYRRLVWHLAVQLDREKRLVRRDFRVPDREGRLKLSFLKYLACEQLLIEDVRAEAEGRAARFIFSGDVILDKARQFWESTGRPAYNYYDLADDVKSTPLLREVGADVFAFAHLTIQEYLAAVELARRDVSEEVFCRAYFDPVLSSTEVLPMTLGLVRKPEELYATLEQLPESITLTSLHLCARGLAYITNPDGHLLSRFTDRLLELAHGPSAQDPIYSWRIFRSLSDAGKQSVQFIVERLAALMRSDGENSIWKVAGMVGAVGGEQAVDALLPLFKGENETSCWRVAAMLGEIRGDYVMGALLPLLRDEDHDVRWRAATTILQIGLKSGGIGIGERVVRALLPLLKDEDSLVRGNAAEALAVIGGEPVMGALLPLLKDKEGDVRRYVARALGKVGGERAVGVLRQLLKDEDRDVRISASDELGKLCGERGTDALLPLLGDKDSFVRARVAEVLGDIGDERAVDALLSMLKDEDGYVYGRAAWALSIVGAERAVGALLPALKEENNRIRWSAASALSNLGDERAADGLLDVLRNDQDGYMHMSAVEGLVKLSGERIADALLPLLGLENERARARAAEALGRMGDERAADALLAILLKDKDRYISLRAGCALWGLGDAVMVAALERAIADEDELVRWRAVQVVGYYAKGEQMLHELERLAAEDHSEEVRNAAAEARDKYERKLAYFR